MSDQKWEYSVQAFSVQGTDWPQQAIYLQSAINKYAEEGWELVWVVSPLHYFRRDKNRKPSELK
jgi:hypothetical protein